MNPTDFTDDFSSSATMRFRVKSLADSLMDCREIWLSDIHIPLRMNDKNFDAPLTFHLAPSSGQI